VDKEPLGQLVHVGIPWESWKPLLGQPTLPISAVFAWVTFSLLQVDASDAHPTVDSVSKLPPFPPHLCPIGQVSHVRLDIVVLYLKYCPAAHTNVHLQLSVPRPSPLLPQIPLTGCEQLLHW
jgi:hypothetical protein